MKLPYWIAAFMPKAIQQKKIQLIWDRKTDKQIMNSFNDATEWIDLSLTLTLGVFGTSVESIAQDCYLRLDKYILPQMRKRGLL